MRKLLIAVLFALPFVALCAYNASPFPLAISGAGDGRTYGIRRAQYPGDPNQGLDQPGWDWQSQI
ncbi:hypothetical protein [Stutzerimonas stutzeri]|uniref:hypothetical protein n=1 Tax=Stutzerimonas stutzeri TaxID=316 RepID=UPI001F178647|nr:hypothetical protein [Stutzerimonas stutzeri]